jgi:hypothetical protein
MYKFLKWRKKKKSQERPTLEPRMLNLDPDPDLHQSEKSDPDKSENTVFKVSGSGSIKVYRIAIRIWQLSILKILKIINICQFC